MKNVDSSFLSILFGAMFLSGIMGTPAPIIIFVLYTIFKSSSSSKQQRGEERDYERRDRRYSRRYERQREPVRQRQAPPARRKPKRAPKNNPFRSSGLAKFKDFDYDGAIEDFTKALQINNEDIAVHFNLACAYSLTEQKDKSMYHIDRAVALGFKDFEKIRTHDALAYLRIQDEYEGFEKSGFRLTGAKAGSRSAGDTALLDQLAKLAELREKGLLTEEEFVIQKKKLLG
ncbi:MAG: tetratricopeptide repeat protein [Saprospiraceae bacterium]